MKPRALRDALRAGHEVDLAWLDDAEYRGISLGLPRWMEALSWKTFTKAFFHGRGWNVRCEQDGLDATPRAKQKRGQPFTFGYYTVARRRVTLPGTGPWEGALIDYDVPENGVTLARWVKDPLVALAPGDPTRLLGWSYLAALGGISTPSYFLLELTGAVRAEMSPGGSLPRLPG
jgi:hypothetical protein